MELIKEFFESNTQTALISMGITALAHIFFAVAVYIDSKINHIKYRVLWTALSLIFGGFTTAIYFVFRRMLHTKVPIVCTKCGKKAPKNAKVCPKCGNNHFAPKHYENVGSIKTTIIALLAAGAVLFAFDAWYTQYSPWAVDEEVIVEEFDDYLYDDVRFGYEENGKIVYYDREGKPYSDPYNVYFYDKDGNIFTFEADLYVSVSGSKKISSEAALVDSNGYFVDAEKEFGNIPSSVPFKDTDGTMYYHARDVSWDKDGKMVYTSNGNQID